MGRREYGVKKLTIKRFDGGFCPNLDFEDVPDNGSPDCRHVFTRRSALRPFPGMELINSTKADHVSGQGVHYLNVEGIEKRITVFGDKIFTESGGTLTDVTGTAVVPVGNLVQFVDHQIGSNKYVIGASGGAPFKLGSGAASALGGSPPNFETIAKYHGAVFGSVLETLYWSDPEDPETWDTTEGFTKFSKNIVSQIENGPKLAVLMPDHIGSIQGSDYLDYFEEKSEIGSVGCVGKLAATKCSFGDAEIKGFATLSKDGCWFIDESFSKRKLFGDNYSDEFSKLFLYKSSMAYWEEEKLLFVALPYAASSECDYLVIVNMKTGAFWPGPSIHGNFIRSLGSMIDASGKEFIYFQDANGYLFRFNMAADSYHDGSEAQQIDYKWKSKNFDLESIHSLGELNMLAETLGNWGIKIGVNFGLSTGDGDTGNITFNETSDLLGVSFVLGASTLGGSDYIFKPLESVGGFGRFVQIVLLPFTAADVDVLGTTFILGESQLGSSQSFRVKRMEVHLHDHRQGGSDK